MCGQGASAGWTLLRRRLRPPCPASPTVPAGDRRQRPRTREDVRPRPRRAPRARRRRHRPARGRADRGRRAFGDRQVDPAAPPRRARPARGGHDPGRRRADRRPPRGPAHVGPPPQGRLRLPVLPPDPGADRRGERAAAGAAARHAQRRPASGTRADRPARARGRRPAPPPAGARGRPPAPPPRAERWRAAAPRGRAGPGPRPAARARRRADRQPRRRGRRGRARPAADRRLRRARGHARHPRRVGDRPGRPRPAPARRAARGMTHAALRRLRAAPRRAALAALGVLLAAAMAGAAITVGYGLHTGFDRAARQADLPDVTVSFDPERRSTVDRIVRRLPNLKARSYRTEASHVSLSGGSGSARNGAVELVAGRRGYAVVAGRDVDGRPGEAVVDRGVANEWGLHVGDTMQVGRLGPVRIAGIAVAPDNVAYPLSSVPHVYVANAWIERVAGLRSGEHFDVDEALVWANDPGAVDVLLQQARATSTGIENVRFLTRSGVRVLVDSAAGIVIALLVAFSLVALAAAGVMLAAGASADVQRRLQTIGIQRAI